MPDLSWLSQEAKTIHDVFMGLYFSMAGVMLVAGIVIEYFKLPLGGSPQMGQLLGRLLISAILLTSYPEIANTIAQVGDGIAAKIGGLNNLNYIVDRTSQVLETKTWSWTSVGDSLLWVISYLVYAILYLTVFIFDAIILYGWTLAYIFSPLLILCFILPQTAGATSALFRSLFEMATWKIVFSTLGTLLWSVALKNLEDGSGNFIVILGFNVLIAFSILFTPKVVSGLWSGGIASVGTKLGAMSSLALSAGAIGPSGLAALMKKPVTTPANGALKMMRSPAQKMRTGFHNLNSRQTQKNQNQSLKDEITYSASNESKKRSDNAPSGKINKRGRSNNKSKGSSSST